MCSWKQSIHRFWLYCWRKGNSINSSPNVSLSALSSPVLLHPWPTLFSCLPFPVSSLLPPAVASLLSVDGFINFQQLEWQWAHYYGNQFINTSFAYFLNCFMKCTLELGELHACNLNGKMGTEWGGAQCEVGKYVMRPLHVAAGTGF